MVDDRLGLLEAPDQALLGDGVLGPEAQTLVVEECPDLLVVDEHRDLLARVDRLAQRGPLAVEPLDEEDENTEAA
jgi:hypothetical protein